MNCVLFLQSCTRTTQHLEGAMEYSHLVSCPDHLSGNDTILYTSYSCDVNLLVILASCDVNLFKCFLCMDSGLLGSSKTTSVMRFSVTMATHTLPPLSRPDKPPASGRRPGGWVVNLSSAYNHLIHVHGHQVDHS